MKTRHVLVCLPDTASAKKVYADVVKATEGEHCRLITKSFLDFPSPGEFSRELRTLIHYSNVVVGILESNNANVAYEIGIAGGCGKPTVLLADIPDNVPTMLKAKNVLHYATGTEKDDVEGLRARFRAFLEASLTGTFLDQRFQDHIRVLLGFERVEIVCEPSISPVNVDAFSAGMESYAHNQFLRATEYLNRALDEGDRHEDAYFYLADSHFLVAEGLSARSKQIDHLKRMQHIAKEGLRAYPRDKRLLKTLGLSQMKLGQFDQAENTFLDLIQEDPEFTVAAYNLSCLNALQRKSQHCLRYLRDALDRNPDWRYLARLDPDFDNMWRDELFQRLVYPFQLP